MIRPGLLVICGPTSSGKTALAIELARVFDGEIVNADSRQIYQGMDIGTAKPTPAERALAPHHMLDLVRPDESFSLGVYAKQARRTVEAIQARGRLPLLVGGTGLYVRAVSEGFDVPEVPPNLAFRAQLEEEVAVCGPAALLQRLEVVDPVSAGRIDARNVRRVIRALEVTEALGEPFSARQRRDPAYEVLTILLSAERSQLFSRADARLETMMRDGFLSEVAGLLDAGYGLELPSMSALGYGELGRHVRGDCSLDDALEVTRRRTHSFIKRQITWFKMDSDARRLDAAGGDIVTAAREMVDSWLETVLGRSQ